MRGLPQRKSKKCCKPRGINLLKYSLINSNWKLVLTDSVLDHFAKNRQLSNRETEAGGQLFASFKVDELWVEIATGPRLSDKRTRFSYTPDKKLEQIEIDKNFKDALHYIGDWHTHPIPVPAPSDKDLANIRSCFKKSIHQLKGFIMLIVGTANYPDGIHLSLHNEHSYEEFVLVKD